jgi:hypothetical protein
MHFHYYLNVRAVMNLWTQRLIENNIDENNIIRLGSQTSSGGEPSTETLSAYQNDIHSNNNTVILWIVICCFTVDFDYWVFKLEKTSVSWYVKFFTSYIMTN